MSNLLKNNKELMSEYYFERNVDFDIDKLTDGSSKKVWWKCSMGHEWKATIRNRAKLKRGCLYCSNQKILAGYNDLATLNPDLAKEWNYEKNTDLKPTMVGAKSGKKVWWKCSKGHEWKAAIEPRNSKKIGCPLCAKEKSISFPEKAVYYYLKKYYSNITDNYRSPLIKNKELDIYITDLKIGIEYDGMIFHKDKKRDLDKDNLCELNGIRVYHISEKLLNEIIIENNYIYYNPKIKGELDKAIEKLLNILLERDNNYNIDIDRDYIEIHNLIEMSEKENSLEYKYPELAKEWDYEKNGNIKPNLVKYSSKKNVWWKCDKGHSYRSVIYNRIKKHGCPYCSNRKPIINENDLFTMVPIAKKIWNYKKNNMFNPLELKENSNIKVWWICDKGHEWEATPSSISRGTRCPYCSSNKILVGYNDLATLNPNLAKEWNYEKNNDLKPTMVGAKSGKKVWWKCSKGHEWETKISNRTSLNRNCPYCSNQKILAGYNDLATLNSNLAKEWNYEKNKDLKPTMVGVGGNKKVWWKCDKGHEWEAGINNRHRLKTKCPYCRFEK